MSDDNNVDFITDPYFQVFVGAIIASFILYIIFYYSVCHTRRETILLLGIRASGKTTVFNRLAHSRYRQPGTSPSETIDKYVLLGSRWRVVDTPGKLRLKYVYFKYYRAWTKGIIFLIDLKTIEEERYNISRYLDLILSDPTIVENNVPILIYCNNRDDISSVDLKSVQKFLERHMTIYKIYFSVHINDPSSLSLFDNPVEPFLFDSCRNKVEFATFPNFTEESNISDLDELMEWIYKI